MIGDYIGDGRGDSGNQIEEKKSEVAEAVFNAAAEYEEKQHVSQQVQPPAVQEHGNEDRANVQPGGKGKQMRQQNSGPESTRPQR